MLLTQNDEIYVTFVGDVIMFDRHDHFSMQNTRDAFVMKFMM